MTGPRLLVAGGDRVDAGKTTFSIGLLAFLERHGSSPTGIKPRAGNDLWFDHDDVCSVLDRGRLYGKDASRLLDASVHSGRSGSQSSGSDPEWINPIHRLWRPTPGRTGLLGETDRTFLVDRVTTVAPSQDTDTAAQDAPPDSLQAGDAETTFIVNGRAESAGLLPDRVLDSVPLADAERVTSVAEFNEHMQEMHLPALESLADRVERVSQPVVVESYADIASPVEVPIDAVAVVDPTRVRLYMGDRYERASRVARGGEAAGQLEERTHGITGMIDPVETIELPPLSTEARTDSAHVADAYDTAYDVLLAVVQSSLDADIC